MQVFEDKPRCFDAWELEPTIDLKKEIVEDCTSVKVRQDAIGWQVDFTWKYHKSEIRQTMCSMKKIRGLTLRPRWTGRSARSS